MPAETETGSLYSTPVSIFQAAKRFINVGNLLRNMFFPLTFFERDTRKFFYCISMFSFDSFSFSCLRSFFHLFEDLVFASVRKFWIMKKTNGDFRFR